MRPRGADGSASRFFLIHYPRGLYCIGFFWVQQSRLFAQFVLVERRETEDIRGSKDPQRLLRRFQVTSENDAFEVRGFQLIVSPRAYRTEVRWSRIESSHRRITEVCFVELRSPQPSASQACTVEVGAPQRGVAQIGIDQSRALQARAGQIHG